MKFPFNFYLTAFAAGLLMSMVSLPFWKKICVRSGLVDDPGERKIHDSSIALAGGLAVFTGLVVPLLLGALALHFHFFHSADALSHGLERRGLQLAAIFTGAIGMLVIGLIDDKCELKPSTKFLGQFFIATLVAASGVRITMFIPSVAFSYFVTIFWILAVTNAFNFMDNMNGLCGGLALIAAWQFGILAAASGQYLVALLSFLIAGAALGFLPYNFPRAKAFLGDSGSHLLGFLLAVMGILPHFYTANNPKTLAVLVPLLILMMPLADLLSVVIIRWKAGKPVYIGDNNHLSHRFVRAGLSQTRAVVFIWALAALGGLLAFALV